MRRLLRDVADNRPLGDTTTLADPTVVEEIRDRAVSEGPDEMSEERQRGVDLFNEAWRLMETREDDDRLLHITHASRYHWGEAEECTPANLARGEWQVSRAYTVLERPEPGDLARAALSRALRGRTRSGTGTSPTPYERSRGRTRSQGDGEAERWKSKAREAGDANREPRDARALRRGLLDSPLKGGSKAGRTWSSPRNSRSARFSRVSGLTVKALRHYDEIGLLEPGSRRRVDRATATTAWSRRARRRRSGACGARGPARRDPELLGAGRRPSVRERLAVHRARLEGRAVETKRILDELDRIIDGREELVPDSAQLAPELEVKEVPARRVAFIVERAHMEEMKKVVPRNINKVARAVDRRHTGHRSASARLRTRTATSRPRSAGKFRKASRSKRPSRSLSTRPAPRSS
jgi:hypothetical protein